MGDLRDTGGQEQEKNKPEGQGGSPNILPKRRGYDY